MQTLCFMAKKRLQSCKKNLFFISISPPISKWSSIPPIPLRCFACSHNEQRQAVVVVVFFFYFIIFGLFFFYQSHVTGDVISHKTSTKTEPSLSHLTFFRTKKSQFNTDTLSSTWVPCWVTHIAECNKQEQMATKLRSSYM